MREIRQRRQRRRAPTPDRYPDHLEEAALAPTFDRATFPAATVLPPVSDSALPFVAAGHCHQTTLLLAAANKTACDGARISCVTWRPVSRRSTSTGFLMQIQL
jgi:hypothetical protein